MSYKVVPNTLSRLQIAQLFENFRKKGGGIFRKIPNEEIVFIHQVLWPVRHFELAFAKNLDHLNVSSITKKRLFMLGSFSMPYVEQTFEQKFGRVALKLLFSKENPSLLATLQNLNKPLPIMTVQDPGATYNHLSSLYSNKLKEFDREIEESTFEMRPLYEEVKELEHSAEEISEKMAEFANDKHSSQYKEYKKLKKNYLRKARSIKKQADRHIDEKVKARDKFVRQWVVGNRRFLTLPKNAIVQSFKNIGTFYHVFWIARYESNIGSRYIIINNQSKKEKILQKMLHFDLQLQKELHIAVNYSPDTNTIVCFYCGNEIRHNQKTCSHCCKDVLTCSVCKLPIKPDDRIGSCPLCESKAHLTHLYEWIKTQGKCPYCLQPVNLEAIITEE